MARTRQVGDTRPNSAVRPQQDTNESSNVEEWGRREASSVGESNVRGSREEEVVQAPPPPSSLSSVAPAPASSFNNYNQGSSRYDNDRHSSDQRTSNYHQFSSNHQHSQFRSDNNHGGRNRDYDRGNSRVDDRQYHSRRSYRGSEWRSYQDDGRQGTRRNTHYDDHDGDRYHPFQRRYDHYSQSRYGRHYDDRSYSTQGSRGGRRETRNFDGNDGGFYPPRRRHSPVRRPKVKEHLHYTHDGGGGGRYHDDERRPSREEGGRDFDRSRHGQAKRPKVEDRHSFDEFRALEVEEKELELEKKRLEVEEKRLQLEKTKKRLELMGGQSVPTKDAEASPPVMLGSNDSSTAMPTDVPAATPNEVATSNANAAVDFDQDDIFDVASNGAKTDSDEEFTSNAKARRTGKAGTKKTVAKAKVAKPKQKKKQVKKTSQGSKGKAKTKKKTKQEEQPQTEEIVATYSETSLMTKYRPTIIDHSLPNNKFLVRWEKSDNSVAGSPCTSWLAFESFVYPGLAQQYLAKVMKRKDCNDDDKVTLASWKRSFKKTEIDDKWNNTVTEDGGVDESSDFGEIDFCCFMCTCQHTDRTLRNCDMGNKLHRVCCHDCKSSEDLEGFVSAAGCALKKLYGLDDSESAENEVGITSTVTPSNVQDWSTKPKAVEVCSGESLPPFEQTPRAAVIVSINSGIGAVAVALKQIGIKAKTIIHVENDAVARHTIRFTHDIRFGETDLDDGIDHVVGLYDELECLTKDPADMIRRFGPIDLIVCSSSGQTDAEHKRFTELFFSFCYDVRRLNEELTQHKSLMYLIETTQSYTCTDEQSSCSCDLNDVNRQFVCNWSLESEVNNLKELGTSCSSVVSADPETVLGFPSNYAINAVTSLFKALKEALTVGVTGVGKWCDNVHPKYWNFLSLGPLGHDFIVDKSNQECSIDSLQLRIREPKRFELLTGKEYAHELMKRSISVRWLVAMLTPIAGSFENRQYSYYTGLDDLGREQDSSAQVSRTSNSATHRGGTPATTQTRVKEEQTGGESTDEEQIREVFGETSNSLRFDI